MYKKVQHTVATHSLIADGACIVVGVSGGADSMALLDCLVRMSVKKNLTLIVAHVYYGVRGDDAKADAARVRVQAANHGLEFCLSDQSAQFGSASGEQSAQNKASANCVKPTEEAMRDARYKFFAQIRDELGADSIAVGHTRNDLVETFFLHLLRGTGLSGLSAIGYKRDDIIRPLLDITRAEVEEYCAKHEIVFGHDVTNDDTYYMRNRIRHNLIPLLASEFNPNICATITRTAHGVSDDYSFLLSQMEDSMIDHELNTTTNTLIFSAQDFNQLDTSIARLTLHHFAQILTNCPQSPLSFGICEQIRTAIASEKSKSHQIHTNALIFARNGDKIKLMRS